VSASRPISRIELGLDDGEPPMVATFNVGGGDQDGRYFRAIAFKPVRSGAFTLTVRAVGSGGIQAMTTCPGVTVEL
jgi:hypothetical protein